MGFDGYMNLGSDLLVDNKIFIDADHGNDTTAERENASKPFATLQAAVNAYQEGDEMIIAGDHVLTASVVLPVSASVFKFNFTIGSSLVADLAAALIAVTNNTQLIEIHGSGTFRNNSSTVTGSARVFSGPVEIFGAKSISTLQGTVLGGGQWRNIRNVEEFYNDQGSILSVFDNPQHDSLNAGFVENVTLGKIGVNNVSTNGLVLNALPASIQRVTFNNVKIIGESLIGTACLLSSTGNGNLRLTMNNCRFIGLSRQRVITSGGDNYVEFNNCYFECNADLAGVNIGNGSKYTFTDCSFKSNGGAAPIIMSANAEIDPPQFHGVNTVEAFGSFSILSRQQVKCPNYGVIASNKPPQTIGTQLWDLYGVSNTPTPGDVFTVLADDGTTASYTVQIGDSQLVVCTGIRDACIAKGNEGNNDFENWTFIVIGSLGNFGVRITNTDTDYNYSTEEGEVWTWSTTGADPIVQPAVPVNVGFVIVGGEYKIDDTLKAF